MTPMIDVVFLLLVFFLAASSFQVVEKALPSAISEKDNSTSGGTESDPIPDPLADQNDIVIRLEMRADEVVFLLNETEIANLEDLTTRLSRIVSIRSDVPIVVDPNPDVPIGYAIAAFDTARGVGSLSVYLTASQPAG